jgi:dolichyl-phosphate beta-glucosyltransferase
MDKMEFNHKLIAIVVPCYNEALRLDSGYFDRLLSANTASWLFVDDGSTDGTLDKLRELSEKYGSTILKHPVNSGKSEALLTGFKYLSSHGKHLKWIGMLDADPAFDTTEINSIISNLCSYTSTGYDAIFTSRVRLSGRKILRKTHRHVVGRLIATLFGLFWRSIPYDTQCGFKFFRASDLTRLKTFRVRTKWFFEIELIIELERLLDRELSIWEIPLEYWKDIGKSKIKIINIYSITLEIIYVLKKLGFTKKRF